MRDLRTYINEALNEKSAVDILKTLWNAGKTTETHLPQDLIDYLVKNGKEVETCDDMIEGKSYLVLTPRMWNDSPEMSTLSYYEKYVAHENMENKKPDCWVYTFVTKTLRIPGKVEWHMCAKGMSGGNGFLPGGCGVERLNKNKKPGFYNQHYYIIEVTPKLQGFADALKDF
jgi:hypothetical protein